eukprot:8965684-Alexandrium_andersonii.AAC.1
MVELPAELHWAHRPGAELREADGCFWLRWDCSTGVKILACSTVEARRTFCMHCLRVAFVHMRIVCWCVQCSVYQCRPALVLLCVPCFRSA